MTMIRIASYTDHAEIDPLALAHLEGMRQADPEVVTSWSLPAPGIGWKA
jgi:hypothetical protein